MKHRQGRRSVLSPEVISGIRRATAGVLAGALMVTALPAITPVMASAAAANYQGSLTSVTSVEPNPDQANQVIITFDSDGTTIEGRITFLEDGIFHYVVDPSGEFAEYATPNRAVDTTRIQAQPDDSDVYETPESVTVNSDGDAFTITADGTTVSFDKDTALMSVSEGGDVVMQEAAPLQFQGNKTVQSLSESDGEDFYGGGTQNGRISHTGKSINIVNEGKWEDGGVASPSPFYWSTDGYGVLRNTFKQGVYDFGKTTDGVVATTHNENKYDAYVFVTDPDPAASENVSSTGRVAQQLLDGYYTVTGDPAFLPSYGFYLGHLNAYNRDSWSTEALSGSMGWTIHGNEPADSAGETTYEVGRSDKYVLTEGVQAESLNGDAAEVLDTAMGNIPSGVTYPYEYSARAVIDEYQKYDMPLGWFLPNDGYGAGYGKNGYNVTGGVNGDGSSSEDRLAAVDANVRNLAAFTEYANSHGVETGLWTQSDLAPDSNSNTYWHRLRDFKGEVNEGGVRTLKTDVAWVSPGYSFELSGVAGAYQTITGDTQTRPNIITLCGWAGTQRYGGIWTGDQTGSEWEYIRFHIPTFIGQGMSGNPNVGSDMDGIFGGGNNAITTRDYQWKSFAPLMLDMDGWGSVPKMPYSAGDPYTGINRMYLKLKARLMPYTLTTAASASNIDTGNDDAGLPIVRAMTLVDDSDYAASSATQYQYMYGDSILVAPIYQDTKSDAQGNDIRNEIFLPGDKDDVWIDYWTGEQYAGGQVLNNYDAPIWKLPIFVKANAIIPMWAENNNVKPINGDNPGGLDMTQPSVEFFAVDGKGSYTLYEDDGDSITNTMTEDEDYGIIENIDYGTHVSTTFTSDVSDGTATFTAEASTGSYDGYVADRARTFVVNLADGYQFDASNVTAKIGDQTLELVAAESKDALVSATPEDDKALYFFDESPEIETYASDEEKNIAELVKNVDVNPKLYVKFAETNVSESAETLTISNFDNDGNIPADTPDKSLGVPAFDQSLVDADGTAPESATPTSISLSWGTVEGATSYELLIDGTLFSVGNALEYLHIDLPYDSSHTYQVRARGENGYSDWSGKITLKTALDPWRNAPTPTSTEWTGGYYNNQTESIALDHNLNNDHFHSSTGAKGNTLTLDYGLAYTLDKFEYYPRADASNGTVTSMKIETSLDGNHWTTIEEATQWGQTAEVKTVEFPENTTARYVRLTPVACVGDFFSARELVVYKTDDSNGFAVGSIMGQPTVGDADVQNMTQYLGGKKGDSIYEQLYGRGDLNGNGYYDAYDYAFTMANVDGGTKQTGDVSGSLAVIPSVTSVKSGEVFTVSLYADDVANVNSLGAVIPIDGDLYEVVDGSISQSPYLGAMQELSVRRDHADRTQSVNLAAANRGNKDLFSGSGAVITFQLKAKQDVANVQLAYESFLVGPTFTFVEAKSDGTVALPEPPEATKAEYAQGAFDITITNSALPTDDGSNVATLIQGGSFEPLFDDVKFHDGDSGSGTMELKWSVAVGDETVFTPLSLHFAFKQPSALDNVVLTNRVNQSGNLVDRGSVKKLSGVINFQDGSEQEFFGGEFDTQKESYTLAISAGNKGKLVSSVDINIDETSATNLMTISEIDFNYTTGGDLGLTGIELGDNKTELYVGDVTAVEATVLPAGNQYPYYTVTSNNPSIVGVSPLQSGDDISYYLTAVGAGEATITVTAAGDEAISKSYQVMVREGVDTSQLTSALAEAARFAPSAYTAESYQPLSDAVAAAQDLIGSGEYTADQVASAVMAIRNAIDGLEMRQVNEAALINTEEAKDTVKVVAASSDAGAIEGAYPECVLDYDQDSYWHSDYNSAVYMPQWLIFDLGGKYDLTDVTFLPRQNGINGDIFEVEILTAASADELKEYAENGYVAPEDSTVVSQGTFSYVNDGSMLANRTAWHQAAFGAEPTQFVMFKVNHSGGDAQDKYCSASEIRFYGTETGGTTPSVDKSELEALVNKVKDTDTSAYTDETAAAFSSALKAAQSVLDKDDATQDEVEGALDELKTAFQALEEKGEPEPPAVNFDDLNAAIKASGTLNGDNYTAESWSNFQAALDAAKDVAANKDATQEQVDEALANLEAAQKALDPKPDTPVVDKFALAEAIAKAESIDTTGKTEESVAALNDAIKAAQAVVDDENATKEQVDAALAKLRAALEGLEDVTEKPGGDDQKPGGDDQKPGDTTKPGDDGQQGGSQQGGSGQQGGGLARTSDSTSFVAVLATALTGAGALAISRKRR